MGLRHINIIDGFYIQRTMGSLRTSMPTAEEWKTALANLRATHDLPLVDLDGNIYVAQRLKKPGYAGSMNHFVSNGFSVVWSTQEGNTPSAGRNSSSQPISCMVGALSARAPREAVSLVLITGCEECWYPVSVFARDAKPKLIIVGSFAGSLDPELTRACSLSEVRMIDLTQLLPNQAAIGKIGPKI